LRGFTCGPRRLDRGLISEVGEVTVVATAAVCVGVPV
jgi:hypothetical protein